MEKSTIVLHLLLLAQRHWTLLLLASIALAFIRCVHSTAKTGIDLLPWVGVNNEPLAKLRASFRQYKRGTADISEGYNKYNKCGQSFVVPTPAAKPVVVLPPSDIHWLVRQPDDLLALPQYIVHRAQSKYFMPSLPKDEFFHLPTIKNGTKQLSVTRMREQVRISVEAALSTHGALGQWHTVRVSDVVRDVVVGISVGLFIGKDQSLDRKLVADFYRYTMWFNSTAFPLHLFVPDILKPLLGPLVAAPTRYLLWRIKQKVRPLIAQWCQAEKTPPGAPRAHESILSHYLVAFGAGDRVPDLVCSRFAMLLGAAVIPTMFLTMNNALLDLTRQSADPLAPTSLEIIRVEAQRLLGPASTSGHPTPRVSNRSQLETFPELPHADSFLKETMRYHTFNGLGLLREVVSPQGLKLSPQVILPKHTWIAVAADAIHHDTGAFTAPNEFQPWRFVSQSEHNDQSCDLSLCERTEKPEREFPRCQESERDQHSKLTTTSDNFLAFGRGRGACPGRFFAADVMKLVLAYMALNYDLRPAFERPVNTIAGGVLRPPEDSVILVRRRLPHID